MSYTFCNFAAIVHTAIAVSFLPYAVGRTVNRTVYSNISTTRVLELVPRIIDCGKQIMSLITSYEACKVF